MIYVLIMALVFGIDQFLKAKLSKKIPENTYVPVIENRLYLTNVKNKGAAMGILKNNRSFLLTFSFCALVYSFLFVKDAFSREGKPARLASSLILAGGLSNIFDRFVKKEVTDYIYIKHKKAPVFNIADAAVLIGAVLALVHELRKK